MSNHWQFCLSLLFYAYQAKCCWLPPASVSAQLYLHEGFTKSVDLMTELLRHVGDGDAGLSDNLKYTKTSFNAKATQHHEK